MPRNVEIKARVQDLSKLVEISKQLCGEEGVEIYQNDTFFVTEKGRLKLRVFKNGEGELIYYDRPDTEGPKLSDYSKAAVSDPESLKTVLSMSLGIKGCPVIKKRLLFIYKQTRIHIDEVEGLGNFMELEVVLSDEESIEDGTKRAEELLEKLGIPKTDLISGSYMDGLMKKIKNSS